MLCSHLCEDSEWIITFPLKKTFEERRQCCQLPFFVDKKWQTWRAFKSACSRPAKHACFSHKTWHVVFHNELATLRDIFLFPLPLRDIFTTIFFCEAARHACARTKKDYFLPPSAPAEKARNMDAYKQEGGGGEGGGREKKIVKRSPETLFCVCQTKTFFILWEKNILGVKIATFF